MEPKTVPKRSRTPSQKYVAPTSPKSPKRTPKMTPKRSQKSEKNGLGCPFFQLKKSSISRSCFFSLFEPSGRPWTLEIKPKRCKGMQKRRSHLFTKNLDFIEKCAKNDLPWDPQNPLKPQKN